MEFIFIRHGHGEHLLDYPNQLNTLHPGLTDYGKMQVKQLRDQVSFNSDDLVLVSPTKRTIETAIMLMNNSDFIVTPLVGPRMFPQNPEFPFLICDQIYSKADITNLYSDIEILDFNLDCWEEGINRIDQDLFEGYARQFLDWRLIIKMPAAAAVCINDIREILMVLQGKPTEEKKWSVPGGGKEENESFEECCVREVWEETGYEVEIKQFIHSKANGLIRYFEVTLLGGAAMFHDPDDLIYDIAWKSLTELKDLIMTYDEDKDLLIKLLTN